MWKRPRLSSRWTIRWLSSGRLEDEGDWFYSSEWWGTEPNNGHTVFQSNSDKGNGVISVIAYPSSRPAAVHWPATERWLQQRYANIHPEYDHNGQFRILGYQWRVLRFNDDTRQSTAKIMAAYRISDPGSVYIMQQPHCLAVPYLKSMVSAGLATLASCNYDLVSAVHGKESMHVLCIGHGGGSLPLFLASKIQGAIVHVVEIDPVVISASTQAMGFPSSALKKSSDSSSHLQPDKIDQMLWKGIYERLFIHELDAEDFILNNTNLYDLVFIDAYDGDDIFPHKLWDPHSPFLKALKSRLHPEHGTVVVNLHADSDVLSSDGGVSSFLHPILPMGKYVSQVCKAYKNVILGKGEGLGLAFTVSVPWLCNISLVVCRGIGLGGATPAKVSLDRDLVLKTLMSKSLLVEDALNLPFSSLEYIKRGFVVVD
ncbi:S-adenosyl-L-methionine-dependent methyltransferases superfamily protein isoform X1 [Tasmannia lanceolata]|uniref:S-adenosyl-L-methionine-dependent methyltransferases superfamily protein isoform X1 n=1 Tax=Tasmannia lanceolata TaxID=3420 RepID=UPI0040635068